jgi:hypothetical protein
VLFAIILRNFLSGQRIEFAKYNFYLLITLLVRQRGRSFPSQWHSFKFITIVSVLSQLHSNFWIFLVGLNLFEKMKRCGHLNKITQFFISNFVSLLFISLQPFLVHNLCEWQKEFFIHFSSLALKCQKRILFFPFCLFIRAQFVFILMEKVFLFESNFLWISMSKRREKKIKIGHKFNWGLLRKGENNWQCQRRVAILRNKWIFWVGEVFIKEHGGCFKVWPQIF